jgi:hypothetical protein
VQGRDDEKNTCRALQPGICCAAHSPQSCPALSSCQCTRTVERLSMTRMAMEMRKSGIQR